MDTREKVSAAMRGMADTMAADPKTVAAMLAQCRKAIAAFEVGDPDVETWVASAVAGSAATIMDLIDHMPPDVQKRLRVAINQLREDVRHMLYHQLEGYVMLLEILQAQMS